MGKTSIWNNKTFVRLLTAYTISIFGDWFDMIAIIALIGYIWNSEPAILGLIPLMSALPGVLLASFAGVIADRFNKIKLMAFADITSAILTFVLAWSPNIYWLLPILLVRATVGLVNIPAQQALTRHVVDEGHLLKATSYNGMINQSAKIIGPLLGGFAIAFLSPQLCIILNGVSSIISASILLTARNMNETVSSDIEKSEETAKSNTFRSWMEGWHLVWKNKMIFNSFLFVFVGAFGIQLIDFQFPVILREYKPDIPSLIGWLIAVIGLGSLLSMGLLNRKQDIKYGWAFGIGFILMATGILIFGLQKADTHILLLILSGFLIGSGNGLLIVAFQFLLQKETPKNAVGRIFGIQNSLFSLILMIAPLSGGLLIQAFGAVKIFVYAGLMVGIVGLVGILLEKRVWTSYKGEKTTISNPSYPAGQKR